MAALTNLLGNGITRLLGIRNLSYSDLEKYAGITKDMIATVDYKGKGKDHAPLTEPGKKGADGKISEAQAKRFFAIAKGAGKTDADIKAYLKETLSIEHTADILKDKYDAVCKWAETKAEERDPGAEG